MTPLVVIGAIAAAPVVVLTVLRVNATLVFLSLCLGSVLVQFVGDDAANTIGIMMSDGSTNRSLISLFLLFAPAVLTTLFMIRSVKGTTKQLLNFFVSIATGSLILLLAEPLLSAGVQGTLADTTIWLYLEKLQVLIVTLGAIFCLLFLWLQRPKHHDDSEKHKK
jgi:hypothetical protein